jgi:hypothetical protein
MTHALITMRWLTATLAGYRIDLSTEAAAHRDIAFALLRSGTDFQHEHVLSPRDRVDFFVDGIAIEVKTQGARRNVLRQLERYAEHDQVTGLILVTAKGWVQGGFTAIGGKPFAVVSLAGAWL